MKFFPSRNFTYHSPLSENEISNRLSGLTRGVKAFHGTKGELISTSNYSGELHANTFRLARTINYRNSFLPQVSGKIAAAGTGSNVEISMRLHKAVLFFFGAVAFIPLLVILAFDGPAGIARIDIGTFAVVLVMYIVCTLAFAVEANIARKDLARLFECEPVAG
jgi:hypothetical protein